MGPTPVGRTIISRQFETLLSGKVEGKIICGKSCSDTDDVARLKSKPDQFDLRLEAIETQWSLVRKAHHATATTSFRSDSAKAKEALVLRYSTAIRRFVAAIVRDETDADELAQEVVLRLLQGDFAGANPDRGRFRDLLKTAIRNMVKNLWSARSRRRETDIGDEAVAAEESASELDELWTQSWRDNVLDIAWSRLQQYEQATAGNISHQLLRIRTEHVDWDMDQISRELSELTNREISPNTVRQQLRRARIRFAEFVVEEVAHGLSESDVGRVHDELVSLGLFEYVKDSLPEKWNP